MATLTPRLRRLSCRVRHLDGDVATAIEALGLDRIVLGMSAWDSAALARVLVAPREGIGVGMPVGQIAALGVTLRASWVLLAGFARAEELERVLGASTPSSICMNASAEAIEWLTGWSGRASLTRLDLRGATGETIERLAHTRGLALRELHLSGDRNAKKLHGGAGSAMARAPALAHLDAFHLSRIDLGRRPLLELLMELPRLTTFSWDRPLKSSRKLLQQAPPRLVRLEAQNDLNARWPRYRRFTWV
jgi:hypothetical protein